MRPRFHRLLCLRQFQAVYYYRRRHFFQGLLTPSHWASPVVSALRNRVRFRSWLDRADRPTKFRSQSSACENVHDARSQQLNATQDVVTSATRPGVSIECLPDATPADSRANAGGLESPEPPTFPCRSQNRISAISRAKRERLQEYDVLLFKRNPPYTRDISTSEWFSC
jgi:hypothetical protein